MLLAQLGSDVLNDEYKQQLQTHQCRGYDAVL